ncbi:MAG: hypothetical protein M3Q40_08730 [Pseudomonadota bacterium]|nr:hypothetical protein [Pseudomonadota bacterium]
MLPSAHAQFRLGNLVDGIRNAAPGFLRRDNPPITTSLSDAVYADAARDGFEPADALALATLRASPQSPFVLRAGYYRMQAQSYCLHAGTYGPSGEQGDGYLYAPPIGPAKDTVMAIVRNSVLHPEIEQRDVQLLLWAILAKTRPQELNPQLQSVAVRLLSPQEFAALGRGAALDFVRGRAYEMLLDQASPQLRQVLQAEARLRDMLTSTGNRFEDIEQVAVLAGMAPVGEGSQAVPSGRWSRHPDGYWVRYLPSAYSSTRVELWVPDDSTAIGRPFDPATHIAVPGNTSRQRLIQSGREYQ